LWKKELAEQLVQIVEEGACRATSSNCGRRSL
jgi:hypothetical protein